MTPRLLKISSKNALQEQCLISPILWRSRLGGKFSGSTAIEAQSHESGPRKRRRTSVLGLKVPFSRTTLGTSRRQSSFRRTKVFSLLQTIAMALFFVILFLTERPTDARERGPVPDTFSRRPTVVPDFKSPSYVIIDVNSKETLLSKDEDEPRSIASITKLMSAMVYVDMSPNFDEVIEITREDRRGARPAVTRLQAGWKLSASDLLTIALVASENPAVEALARSTGLTRPEFVGMMNRKAQELGMSHSIFFDATGLDANNTSTPRDVAIMLEAAAQYAQITAISKLAQYTATVQNSGRKLQYSNSNRLVASPNWSVRVGKTGYITDAGYCLALTAQKDGAPELRMVFLGATTKLTRFGDAARAMSWADAELTKMPTDAADPK